MATKLKTKAAAKTGKKPIGRPSLFTEKLANTICEQIANKFSLRQICQNPGMPSRQTVHDWMAENPTFLAKCARAREEQADFIVEDCIEIEDRTISGEINPAAARAVLSSKQWRASKLAPKKYGDTLAIGGSDDLPPVKQDINLTPAEAYRQILG